MFGFQGEFWWDFSYSFLNIPVICFINMKMQAKMPFFFFFNNTSIDNTAKTYNMRS